MAAEDKLRRSDEGDRIYAQHGREKGYMTATAEIQGLVARSFVESGKLSSVEEGLDLLHRAPHVLGREEGSKLAAYIKGSYAIHPAQPERIVKVGDVVPDTVELIPVTVTQEEKTEEQHVRLIDIIKKRPFTVLFAGSAT